MREKLLFSMGEGEMTKLAEERGSTPRKGTEERAHEEPVQEKGNFQWLE